MSAEADPATARRLGPVELPASAGQSYAYAQPVAVTAAGPDAVHVWCLDGPEGSAADRPVFVLHATTGDQRDGSVQVPPHLTYVGSAALPVPGGRHALFGRPIVAHVFAERTD